MFQMGEYDVGEPDEDLDYVALSAGWVKLLQRENLVYFSLKLSFYSQP